MNINIQTVNITEGLKTKYKNKNLLLNNMPRARNYRRKKFGTLRPKKKKTILYKLKKLFS